MLTIQQRALLRELAKDLRATAWEPDEIQATIFAVARRIPIAQPDAFRALYRVLFDRASGPKAGNVLAFLDRAFVVGRLEEVEMSVEEFWRDTGLTETQLEDWLATVRPGMRAATARFGFHTSRGDGATVAGEGMGIIEIGVTLDDGKTHVRRHVFESWHGTGSSLVEEREQFILRATEYLHGLETRFDFTATVLPIMIPDASAP
jgi:hypothetical protein